MYKTKKKGELSVFTTTIIGFFVITTIFVSLTLSLQPVLMKIKIHQIGRQALLRMEIDGGITSTTRQRIIDNMNVPGFDPANLTIEPTENITDTIKANYGEQVHLKITYKFIYDDIQLVGLTEISKVPSEAIITFDKSITSTNAR